MPKLDSDKMDRNQREIEAVALSLFTRQGFHGTSVRDIANKAGVSMGKLYVYYASKEELYNRIVERYQEQMHELQRKVLGSLAGAFEPAELKRLAKGIREIVYDHSDYWRLMYLDVIEFDNQHFAHTVSSLAEGMKLRLGDRLNEGKNRRTRDEIDRAFAFTVIYLQFFTYFVVEKLFGGKQHLGMPDDRVVEQLIKLFTEGLGRKNGPRSRIRMRRMRQWQKEYSPS
jgi:TetR/AcrR family transcriptional regulator, acrAB operon repressor